MTARPGVTRTITRCLFAGALAAAGIVLPAGPARGDGVAAGLSVTFDEAEFRAKHRIAVTETFKLTVDAK